MQTRLSDPSAEAGNAIPPRRPPTLSVFSSLPPLLGGDLLRLFDRGAGHGAAVVRLDASLFRLYQINDERLVREVLLDRDRIYRKGSLMRRLAVVTGEGLLINDGELWKRHRRLANPAMSGRRLEAYTAAMGQSARLLVERWGGAGPRVVDALPELSEITLISLLRTIFGIDYDARYAGVSGVIHGVLAEVVRRGSALFPVPLSWPTPANRRFKHQIAEAEAVLDRIIGTRAAGLAAEDDPDDLLGQWLRQREQDSSHFTPAEMRDELMTMLIAGHHSLAIGLAWALYEVAGSPQAQRRMQVECDALPEGALGQGDLDGLPYTRGVFLEALRLYPQPPILLREALRDHLLGGYGLRAGDQLLINVLAVHRDPAFWPEPLAYRPDRYLDFNVDAMMQGHYLAFGGGPRSCIGRRFALLEGCLLLAQIARAFNLSRAVPGPVEARFAGMMVPERPLMLRVERRA